MQTEEQHKNGNTAVDRIERRQGLMRGSGRLLVPPVPPAPVVVPTSPAQDNPTVEEQDSCLLAMFPSIKKMAQTVVKSIKDDSDIDAEDIRYAQKESAKRARATEAKDQEFHSRQDRAIPVFTSKTIDELTDSMEGMAMDQKRRITANILVIKKGFGYRTVPNFKGVHKELKSIGENFANFSKVLAYYSQEMTLAGASRPEKVCISPIILDGPPGVGKTAFAQALAKKLDLPFLKISAGGMQNAFTLCGSDLRWGNTHPGEIFRLLSKNESATAVLIIDEVDKISASGEEHSVNSALLDLLEPESSSNYRDESLSISFDASKLIIIMTSNNLSNISAPLLSRCKIFRIEMPDSEQKMKIARDTHDNIVADFSRGNKTTLDIQATKKLIDSDADLREIIRAIRAGCAQALHTKSRVVVPVIDEDDATKDETEWYQGNRLGFTADLNN